MPPAPTDMPNLLNAPHLQDMEDRYLAAEEAAGDGAPQPELPPPVTMADAVDALRRIAYHRRRIRQIEEQVQALIAPLQAEIDRIKEWGEQQKKDVERRIRFHENRLRLFYYLNKPAKGKTIKLPNGTISMRSRDYEWERDEAALLEWARANATQFVEHKPQLKWGELKRQLEVRPDGTVAFKETGEVVPGVRALEREPEFRVEVFDGDGTTGTS